ncbi:MAG: hypothetical protein LBQ18_02170 [Campylobacteraceae bacterium]|jgi:hypothetical protein|nr:hypothetical protein [Campylobacteraceae bacterium]
MPYNNKAHAYSRFVKFALILDEFMQNNGFIFEPRYQSDEEGQEFIYEMIYYKIEDAKVIADMSNKEAIFRWLNANIKHYSFYIVKNIVVHSV